MLRVKRLTETAVIPTIGHPGEDLAYDLYIDQGGVVPAHGYYNFTTGIAVEFTLDYEPEIRWGFLIKERSSLAAKGLCILGGVVDAGYRGQLHLMLGNHSDEDRYFNTGDKVANLIPLPVVAKKLEIVTELSDSERGVAAFGSTN